MITQLFLAAAASAAVAAPAATPASPAAAAPAPAAPVAEAKMICKNEPITGSRVGGTRVCMSKAQWDARGAANRGMIEDMQTRGYQFQN